MLTYLKIQKALEETLSIQNAVWIFIKGSYQHYPVPDKDFSCLGIVVETPDGMYRILYYSKTHLTDTCPLLRFNYLFDCSEQSALARFKSFAGRQLKPRFDKSILDYLSELVVL